MIIIIILSHDLLFQAHVSFSPTLDQQRKCPGCNGTLIDGDFIMTYDVNREKDLGDIQVQLQRHFLKNHMKINPF